MKRIVFVFLGILLSVFAKADGWGLTTYYIKARVVLKSDSILEGYLNGIRIMTIEQEKEFRAHIKSQSKTDITDFLLEFFPPSNDFILNVEGFRTDFGIILPDDCKQVIDRQLIKKIVYLDKVVVDDLGESFYTRPYKNNLELFKHFKVIKIETINTFDESYYFYFNKLDIELEKEILYIQKAIIDGKGFNNVNFQDLLLKGVIVKSFRGD